MMTCVCHLLKLYIYRKSVIVKVKFRVSFDVTRHRPCHALNLVIGAFNRHPDHLERAAVHVTQLLLCASLWSSVTVHALALDYSVSRSDGWPLSNLDWLVDGMYGKLK